MIKSLSWLGNIQHRDTERFIFIFSLFFIKFRISKWNYSELKNISNIFYKISRYEYFQHYTAVLPTWFPFYRSIKTKGKMYTFYQILRVLLEIFFWPISNWQGSNKIWFLDVTLPSFLPSNFILYVIFIIIILFPLIRYENTLKR